MCPLQNFHYPPPFILGKGPGFHDFNLIAYIAGILLIMGLELIGFPEGALVQGMPDQCLYGHHHGFIHFIADHVPGTGLT
jgi:hypothetical protein